MLDVRIDRLRLTRFWLPVWMAATALVLHQELDPWSLALLATSGIGVVFLWDVRRERARTARVRGALQSEIAGHLYRLTKTEGVRRILTATVSESGVTVRWFRHGTGAIAHQHDPLVPTWLRRHEEVDLGPAPEAHYRLAHLVAAIADLEEWQRAFDAGDFDVHRPLGVLGTYDLKCRNVMRWAVAWLRLHRFDWEAFVGRMEKGVEDVAKFEAAVESRVAARGDG